METIILKTRILPEERETHLSYDPNDDSWHMDSNITRHFNKALKTGWTPTRKYIYEDGSIAAMSLTASERGITIKTPIKREMSEEHKSKLFVSKTT